RLRLPREQVETIRLAARIHDIGQLNLETPDLPTRPGGQQPGEGVRRHVTVGKQLAEKVPRYRFAGELILHHHERYDGAGLPDGLQGEAIPLAVRVLATADVWDEYWTDQSDPSRAVEGLQREAGGRLDPRLVALLCEMVAERLPS